MKKADPFSVLLFLIVTAMLAIGTALYGQEPTDAFGIEKPEIVIVYKAPDVEMINANGAVYFAFLTEPVPTDAVLIPTLGDHQRWIVVRKMAAGAESVALEPYEKNKYLFEHSGAGKYEVSTRVGDDKPAFAYFTIGPKPDEPPPVDDSFSDLLKIARDNIPRDQTSVNALGSAWLARIKDLTAPAVTLDQAKQQIGKSRADALSMIRDPGAMGWNAFLLAIDRWFSTQPAMDKARYLAAMTALAKEMAKWSTF